MPVRPADNEEPFLVPMRLVEIGQSPWTMYAAWTRKSKPVYTIINWEMYDSIYSNCLI